MKPTVKFIILICSIFVLAYFSFAAFSWDWNRELNARSKPKPVEPCDTFNKESNTVHQICRCDDGVIECLIDTAKAEVGEINNMFIVPDIGPGLNSATHINYRFWVTFPSANYTMHLNGINITSSEAKLELFELLNVKGLYALFELDHVLWFPEKVKKIEHRIPFAYLKVGGTNHNEEEQNLAIESIHLFNIHADELGRPINQISIPGPNDLRTVIMLGNSVIDKNVLEIK